MRFIPFFSAFAASAALLLVAPASSVGSELLAYWDLNGATLMDASERTAGDMGSLEATFAYVGVGALRLSPEGTVENVYGSSPAGTALEFHDFADVVAVGHFGVNHLDLRGYTAPTISFAYQKTSAETLFDEFWLEYRIGHGSWTKVADVAQPGEVYSIFSYTFLSGQLDGHQDVDIRVRFREVVSIDASFLVDNLQITAAAIPEPGSIVLLGSAAALLAVARRRRG